jgi:hypothetical protein
VTAPKPGAGAVPGTLRPRDPSHHVADSYRRPPSLPYRRFPTCELCNIPAPHRNRRPAGWKPATQQVGNRRHSRLETCGTKPSANPAALSSVRIVHGVSFRPPRRACFLRKSEQLEI